MRFVLCFAVAVAALIAQSILHHVGLPGWLVPQGLLICVVFLAFYECNLAGAVTSFILGLFLDSSSGILLGPWAGAYVIVFGLFAFLSQRLFFESVIVGMVIVASAVLLSGGIFLLLAFEYQVITRGDIIMLVGQALSSAFTAPLLFNVLRRVWKRSGLSTVSGRAGVISAV